MFKSPLLRVRDGRLLLASQALSFLAHGISSVALPWLVLDDHGSTAGAGLVFTFTTLPYVLFGLAAGVVGDRYPSRRVIWLTHLVQAAIALVVPIWAFSGAPPVAVVLVAAFAIGTGRVFSDAAVFGALVGVVGKQGIVHGQATLGAAWAVGLLAGPALGGVLIATVGPARALAIEAAGFAIAAVVVRAMHVTRTLTDEPHLPARAVVLQGLQLIFGDRVIRTVTLTGMSWCAFEAGAWALTVPLLREELGLGSGETGAVLAAGAAMGILGSPIVGALDARIGGLRIVALAIPLSGVSIAALGLAPTLALALVAFCGFELSAVIATAAMIGERQRQAPLSLQSTVGISGRMVIMTSLAAGSAVASGLAAAVELRTLYVGLAIGTLAVSAAALPRILRLARARAAEATA